MVNFFKTTTKYFLVVLLLSLTFVLFGCDQEEPIKVELEITHKNAPPNNQEEEVVIKGGSLRDKKW